MKWWGWFLLFLALALACVAVRSPINWSAGGAPSLPFIGPEPYEHVEPALTVSLSQDWLHTNVSATFAVNVTVVWMLPRSDQWTATRTANYSLFLIWRNLCLEQWGSPEDMGIRHRVNVSVAIGLVQGNTFPVDWHVNVQDDRVGWLFDRTGTLWQSNDSARIQQAFAFTTYEYPICGGCEPDLYDLLAFFWPWAVIGCVVALLYEAWVHWPRKLATSSPAASSP